MRKQRVVILGSTGSIGVNALKVIEAHSGSFEVAGLAAGTNTQLLAEQIRQFKPQAAAMLSEAAAVILKKSLNGAAPELCLAGQQGVDELAALDGVDVVIVAITGAAALTPTLRAIERGRRIGLANKETLVMAGALVMDQVRAHGSALIPIDSEHSAVFQCLQGNPARRVRRILLTSSGGPLRCTPAESFGELTKQEVMRHPRWKMGPKITVDSATMMNKALEVIEARWLFDLPIEKIQILVHPEAIVHSMVEYVDGSVMAQLGVTDMRIPIQYALTWPDRLASALEPLDLVQWKQLNFEAPDPGKFPCLRLGAWAAAEGGTLPAVLNAANETAVEAFLADQLTFVRIPVLIEQVMQRHRAIARPDLSQIMEADRWAREQVAEQIGVAG